MKVLDLICVNCEFKYMIYLKRNIIQNKLRDKVVFKHIFFFCYLLIELNNKNLVSSTSPQFYPFSMIFLFLHVALHVMPPSIQLIHIPSSNFSTLQTSKRRHTLYKSQCLYMHSDHYIYIPCHGFA